MSRFQIKEVEKKRQEREEQKEMIEVQGKVNAKWSGSSNYID